MWIFESKINLSYVALRQGCPITSKEMRDGHVVSRGLGVVAVGVVAATLVPASAAQAADSRLDEALLALQKAKGLPEASRAGNVSDKVIHEFSRHIERGISDIDKCSAEIEAAKQAVDNA